MEEDILLAARYQELLNLGYLFATQRLYSYVDLEKENVEERDGACGVYVRTF